MYKAFKNKFIFSNYFVKNKNNYKLTGLYNGIKNCFKKIIISTIDEASNNFCIMYKVFYKKLLMDKQLDNSTYTKLTSPYSEIKNRFNAFAKK